MGNVSCLSCKHSFFSDCYLECMIHDRINNPVPCENFKPIKENNEEVLYDSKN